MYAVICDSACDSFFFAMVATWLCLLLDLAFGVLTFPHQRLVSCMINDTESLLAARSFRV